MKPLEENIENMIHGYQLIKGSESNYEVWLEQYNRVNNDSLSPWLKIGLMQSFYLNIKNILKLLKICEAPSKQYVIQQQIR